MSEPNGDLTADEWANSLLFGLLVASVTAVATAITGTYLGPVEGVITFIGIPTFFAIFMILFGS